MSTEQHLRDMLASFRILRDDWVAARPNAMAIDNAWDDAEAVLIEAVEAMQHAVYLATEVLADDAAVEAGDMTRLPDGSVVPVAKDSRR